MRSKGAIKPSTINQGPGAADDVGDDDGVALSDHEVEEHTEVVTPSRSKRTGKRPGRPKKEAGPKVASKATKATSIRGKRAEEMERSGVGVMSSDGRTVKGQARQTEEGGLEWLNEEGIWVAAVYHNSLREKLIRKSDQWGKYDHGRIEGKLGNYDITSFHPGQKEWGPSRAEHWPYMPGGMLFLYERRDYQDPTYEIQIWIDEGRVVLDHDDKPVRLFDELPLTLSSDMEPWLAEQIQRMDSRITGKDLRARMPKEPGLLVISGVGMRQVRFREQWGIPPWKLRDGSDHVRYKVAKLLTPQQLEDNSTQFLQGWDKDQAEGVKMQGRGTRPERAGSKQLDAETRRKKAEADQARWAKIQEARRAKGLPAIEIPDPTPSQRRTKTKKRKRGDPEGVQQPEIGPQNPSDVKWPKRDELVEFTLGMNIEEYQRWMVEGAPPIDPHGSYQRQYVLLQRFLNRRWLSHTPPPTLTWLPPDNDLGWPLAGGELSESDLTIQENAWKSLQGEPGPAPKVPGIDPPDFELPDFDFDFDLDGPT